MYRINDTISAIKEIQRLLGINQTGNYDKATRKAVGNIQQRYSLPVTEVSDYLTFNALVKEYRASRESVWENNFLFSPSFPYVEGNIGDDVGRINDALSKVLFSYGYEGEIPKGKYFGKNTIDGMYFLQQIFGMQKSKEMNAAFMNRILLELDGIKIKELFGIK